MGPAANCSLEGAGGASFLPVRVGTGARCQPRRSGHRARRLIWNRLDPVPPCRRWRSVHRRWTAAGQGGKGLPLGNPGPVAMADCRESPSLWMGLHRPGATRHPWRDAPLRRPPDGSPAPSPPPFGPADGADIGVVAETDISPQNLINKSQIKLIYAKRTHSTG